MNQSDAYLNEDQRESKFGFQPVFPPVIEPGRSSGEPQRTQHLILDFSPNAEDCEEQSAKCMQFWEFIRIHPQFQELFTKLQKENEFEFTEKTSDKKTGTDPVFMEHPTEYCPCVDILTELEQDCATAAMATLKDYCFKTTPH